ncbi:MAG: class I SAM-dependent methyltransferase [Myxococcota bacterium]
MTETSAKVSLDSAHFDAVARQWDENPIFVDRARRIADGIRTAVPLTADMRALDFGSGTGMLSFPLQPQLGHVTLTDTSPGMLAVAKEKIADWGISNMDTRLLDLTATALPDERYDLIYSSMALHHVPDTDAILKTFHTLLDPGGWLCLADLDQEDGSFHGVQVDVHHGFARETLAAQATRAGFTGIGFSTVLEVVKETEAGTRAFPVFLLVARR